MATARAFGQITIVDVTDVGQFSVYPMSNLPQSVIYSPDNNSYSPDWSASATYLVLTPVVHYAGRRLTLGTAGLSVSWKKMIGSSQTTTDVVSTTNVEEIDANGILTVKTNQFNPNSSQITYIAVASYREPTSGILLEAEGIIPFSLMKIASGVRNVYITGDNVFKYNMSNVPDKQETTLKAIATDTLTINDWEYSNNNGTSWTSLNNPSSSLKILESSSIFSGDTVLVRVKAQDVRNANSFYYDYVTVLKLRDGTAAGNSLTISNENQSIPCIINTTTNVSTPTATAFNKAYTAVYIMENGQDVTNEYSIEADPDGVLGAWTTGTALADKPNGTTSTTAKGSNTYYWVTGWDSSNTSDVASVLFTATKGTETLIKRMSLSKSIPGEPGESPIIYSIDVSSLTTNKSYGYSNTADSNGNYAITSTTYSPNSITATVTKTIGDSTTSYTEGYVKVYVDGVLNQGLSGNAIDGTFTLSGLGSSVSPSTIIRFDLYSGSGANDKLLDSQSVVVTSDGIKGNQGEGGEPGASAISFNFSNPFDNIAVNSDGTTMGTVTLRLPFAAYEGTTKINCTITNQAAAITIGQYSLPSNAISVNQASASSDGSIVYTIPTGTQLLANNQKSANGSKSLTFTYNTPSGATGTFTAVYGWSITASGSVGKDATFLQMATPYGYIYDNGEGSLNIVAILTEGGVVKDLDDDVTYKWYKFDPSLTPTPGYVEIKQSTGSYEAGNLPQGTTINDGASINSDTLTVYGNVVESFASFKCVASYKNNDYEGYQCLEDKTDPIQVAIISSVGEQIVNGNGTGYFWARVIRNDGQGTELDPLPTGVSFVTSKPDTLVNGAFYYHLDETAKTATLKKATSTSAWQNATDSDYSYEGTYRWTYRDYNNQVITNTQQTPTPATSGKVVYVDASLINKKIIIDVEVEI